LVNITSACGLRTGSAHNRTLLSKLKIAVFAPIPSASERTATAVKEGVRRNERTANRRS
jgi:hypothetical protein